MSKRSPATHDLGLQQIDDLERAMILAHEQKALDGTTPGEIDRFRTDAVALAKAVTDRLRAEYLARRSSQP